MRAVDTASMQLAPLTPLACSSYNKRIIIASLAMDVLIIGMMSLPNSFVYMQVRHRSARRQVGADGLARRRRACL